MDIDNLPTDPDGNAIRGVFSRGSSSSEPMLIDFQIGCPSRDVAEQIADAVPKSRYGTKIYTDEEDPDDIEPWTVESSRNMLLTYDGVIECQNELTEVAKKFGCICEAWGTFGNAQKA
ncbi:MAG: ribonuclease E inhibitor RraB [Verrucomicrobiota bacterium]